MPSPFSFAGLPFIGAKSGSVQSGSGFNRILNIANFYSSGSSTSLTASQFNKVGTGHTVPVQQQRTWGWGGAANPDNQGFLYFQPVSPSNAKIASLCRFAASNNPETIIDVVIEERSERTDGGQAQGTVTTDRRLLDPFPMKLAGDYKGLRRIPSENDILQIYLNPDATATISGTNSQTLLPVTVFVV